MDYILKSVEIAKYLDEKFIDNHMILVSWLEKTLQIEIDKTHGIYFFKDNFICNSSIHDHDLMHLTTELWKLLDDNQKQTLVKKVEEMQNRDNTNATNKASANQFIINNTNNNTNTVSNVSIMDCKNLSELNSTISSSNTLSNEVKQEYKEILSKLDDAKDENEPNGYLEILSDLLTKLASDNLCPPFLDKAVKTALKLFK